MSIPSSRRYRLLVKKGELEKKRTEEMKKAASKARRR